MSMNKKVLKSFALFILMFILLIGCIDIEIPIKQPNTVYVNIDGSADFISIQNAIDDGNTLENFTVLVYPGEYYENIVVNKSINLIGNDARNTIINADFITDGIKITADKVNVSGFTIKNSGFSNHYPDIDAGIDVTSSNVNISRCIVMNHSVGIYSNRVINNMYYQNELFYCSDYAMYIYSGSDYTTIEKNVFHNNSNYGLRIKGSKYTQVIKNVFRDNTRGMYFCCGARENTVYHNNFINNSMLHADDYVSGNKWYNSEMQQGNFWDDFYLENQGAYDNDSNGTIDSPYVIKIKQDGTIIQDEFPLSKPYELNLANHKLFP